jgi:hypothetical protein
MQVVKRESFRSYRNTELCAHVLRGSCYVFHAFWRVRKLYGLTDKIEEKLDHNENKTELAQKIDLPIEILGKNFGFSMKRDLNEHTYELTEAFTPTGYAEAQITVYVGDSYVRIVSETDRKAVALAKIKIISIVRLGQAPVSVF